MTHYLDYNATAPMRPEVAATMEALLRMPLNASSVHAQGRKAKSLLEDARRQIAESVSAFPPEVIFTASGTEANNWVLSAHSGMPLLVSAIEHSSILKAPEAVIIDVDTHGILDMGRLKTLLPHEGPFLVSVMLANNETGVIQPVRAIAEQVHSRGGLLHCDAVQALGKIEVDFTALGCDFMTLSAHKMGGPVGAAALVVKNGVSLPPLLKGGGQELNRRAGTENVAAIAGFAKAVTLMDFEQMEKVNAWLKTMEAEISSASKGEAVIFGSSATRLPNTSCIAMPNVSAETQLIRFDLEGIHTSAGSACSSGRIEPSHVLQAMGVLKDIAATALRISAGWATQEADLKALAAAWKALFMSRNG